MESPRKRTLMQLQVSLPKKIILTLLIMSVSITLVYSFNIPNPNMILIAGLVLCSALFGFGGGTVAALIMLGYSLFFFSTGNDFVTFTPQNRVKVAVSLIGIAADMLFVCLLKRAELQAFREIDLLTEELHRENAKLYHVSVTDPLTGIRNRMALRHDYDGYQGHDAAVMMLDLNDFKLINDTRGHEVGDSILCQTGALLAEVFGREHCYRYGGDEFLVVVPDITEEDFKEKLRAVMDRRPMLDGNKVGFSAGWVYAPLDDRARLRALIANADERMYEEKRDKAARAEAERRARPTQEIASEYTVQEMRSFLGEMNGKYDLARVVDPNECRILEFKDNGAVSMSETCYGIWNSEQKCINCSSARACRTGCRQEKAERFQDKLFYIQSNPVSLKLGDGSRFDAVVELVSVEKEENARINDREAENVGTRAMHYLAHHDSLTNILNADAFYELSRELLHDSPDRDWVMVTGNIMNFRLVNSLFGVLRGNEVLVKTANALREIADAAQGLCGRLGGDQFALLLPKEQYAERQLLAAAAALARSFNSGVYSFCIHFGVYEIDDPAIPVSVMCGRANSALRTIREDMSTTVAHFDEAIMRRLSLEQTVTGSFEQALREEQFQMYLQPFAARDGSFFGAEALVRWQRPDGTVMMPGDFIETLERAGLIHRLDLYIWERAVRQLAAWKGTDKAGVAISINMSAKDFVSLDVYAVLTGLIERYGVESRLLRLEITETALLVDPEKISTVIASLRSRGFLVEIDDFGKGYSSLSLLKDLHADVLKIDMEFLHEIEHCERNGVILRTVIDLAFSLGMDVITEGVETRSQFETLSAMGCRQFQGYYFSRPIPVPEFESLFSRAHALA